MAREGRADALVPVNHASRAYYAANQGGARGVSNVRYVEVTNAQHFDAFIAFGALLGYDTRFIPLHYYFGQAMYTLGDDKYGKMFPDEKNRDKWLTWSRFKKTFFRKILDAQGWEAVNWIVFPVVAGCVLLLALQGLAERRAALAGSSTAAPGMR